MNLSVAEVGIVELAKWIYAGMPEEQTARVHELKQRMTHGPAIHAAWQSDSGLAFGAYFYSLPGGVLTLGGIRTTIGAAECVQPFEELMRKAREIDTSQVQAVVPKDIEASVAPVLQPQFKKLADVFHIYRSTTDDKELTEANATEEAPVRWRPAHEFSKRFVAERIAETFEGTLDCPELNGLRTNAETLDGFLDGKVLREMPHWYLLEIAGKLVGCVLLSHHEAHKLLELTYMGVRREARLRGLGKNLVELAIQRARELRCTGVAAAVDQRNVPALKVYEKLGFLSHAEFGVWLDANTATSR